MLVWLKEHLDIMEALVAGDLEEASALMRVHLLNAMNHRWMIRWYPKLLRAFSDQVGSGWCRKCDKTKI